MWASVGGVGIEVVALQSWANNVPRSARSLQSWIDIVYALLLGAIAFFSESLGAKTMTHGSPLSFRFSVWEPRKKSSLVPVQPWAILVGLRVEGLLPGVKELRVWFVARL